MAYVGRASSGQALVGTSSDNTFANPINSDFGITSSTSGATRTFTVSSTSNTASSSANIVTSVAGGTAADPTHQFIVTGITTWTTGADNSVSDNYTISASASLGTTDVFRATTAGIISYPLQPAFYATKSANSTNATGDGTAVSYVCDNEVNDQGGNYNNSTGVFTVPTNGAGYYTFTLGIFLDNVSGTDTIGLLELVATSGAFALEGSNYGNTRDGSTHLILTRSITVFMAAGDTAFPRVTVSGGAKTVTIAGGSVNTYFLGVKVA